MSNLSQRILVAAVGIPLLVYAAVCGNWALLTVIAVIQAVALWEWSRLSNAMGTHVWIPGAAAVTLSLDYFILRHGGPFAESILIAVLMLVMLSEVFRRDRQPLRNLGGLILFAGYVALPLALWGVMSESHAAARWQPAGPLAILLATTWICDSAAYFGGKQLGRHKLHVAASPNKTVEGFIAGVIFAALILPTAGALGLAEPSLIDYLALPLIVGIAGQIGDLLESLMKREIHVKDTSSVLPGHGGFLDRFDSLLISSPLLFAYLILSPA
jgi:phosphatidate cytidylyltransferase